MPCAPAWQNALVVLAAIVVLTLAVTWLLYSELTKATNDVFSVVVKLTVTYFQVAGQLAVFTIAFPEGMIEVQSPPVTARSPDNGTVGSMMGLDRERTDGPEQVVEQIELARQCRGCGRCHIECHRGVRIVADALHADRKSVV